MSGRERCARVRMVGKLITVATDNNIMTVGKIFLPQHFISADYYRFCRSIKNVTEIIILFFFSYLHSSGSSWINNLRQHEVKIKTFQ